LWRAIEIETLAKMYVHALAIGEPPHLSDKEMAQVIEQMRRMGYGEAPDLDKVKDTPKLMRVKAVAVAEKVEKPARQYPKAIKAPSKATSPASAKAAAKPAIGEKPATKAAPTPRVKAPQAAASKAKAPAKKGPTAKWTTTAKTALADSAPAVSFKSLVGSALNRRK
jgi:hypothetical protein